MRMFVRWNGEFTDYPEPVAHDEIRRLIGCEGTDSVTLRDRVHVMILDDVAAKKGLPVNNLGTQLYWDKCGGKVDWVICGNVFICPDADFAMPSKPL